MKPIPQIAIIIAVIVIITIMSIIENAVIQKAGSISTAGLTVRSLESERTERSVILTTADHKPVALTIRVMNQLGYVDHVDVD